MDLSDAAVAQVLDELAEPPIVECVECGADIVLTQHAKACTSMAREAVGARDSRNPVRFGTDPAASWMGGASAAHAVRVRWSHRHRWTRRDSHT